MKKRIKQKNKKRTLGGSTDSRKKKIEKQKHLRPMLEGKLAIIGMP